MAITKFDQFDFLIDIVPRDDIKPATRKDDSSVRMAPDQVRSFDFYKDDDYCFSVPGQLLLPVGSTASAVSTEQQQQQQWRTATTIHTTADPGAAGCAEWGTDHQRGPTAVTASGQENGIVRDSKGISEPELPLG